MKRYIAFLRAINVGGHTVKMEHLRALLGAIELHNVETFIASGNAIFDSPVEDARMLEGQIEQHLKQALGYEVATFLRTPAELAAVAAYKPFATAELETVGSSLYIAFTSVAPGEEAQRKLLAHRSDVDEFHVHGREAYWLCRIRSSDSAFNGARLEKALGMPATLRNVTTVRKLAALYAAP